MFRKTVLVLGMLLSAFSALGQQVEPSFARHAVGEKPYAAAPRAAERAGLAPAAVLAPATEVMPEEIEAVREWNDAGRLPTRNGFRRSVGDPISVRLEPSVVAATKEGTLARGVLASSEGKTVWSGSIEIEGAYRVRLHLKNAQLPPGATLWTYGPGDAPIGFGRELLRDGELYTPSVTGGKVHLELEIPTPTRAEDGASFEIAEVIELLPFETLTSRTPGTDDVPSCLIDANCVAPATFDHIVTASRAVGHMQYLTSTGAPSACTGGLLNDKDTTTFQPYFLTANHCLSTGASAGSLEVFWDYKTSFCGGPWPNLGSVPRSSGATLLATSPGSDFSFLLLNSVPAGRLFLGWNAGPIPHATLLHRVSHPIPPGFTVPGVQAYSTTYVNTTLPQCGPYTRPNFLYSSAALGGTYGGSSGSPVILAGGYVVGQLWGRCTSPGRDPTAGCDPGNWTIDGAFSATFPAIEQWINREAPPPCSAGSTTICLNNNRFQVAIDYRTSSGQTGTGGAVKYTPETGLFYFFGADNIEVLVKVLNGCGLNNRYWVFSAATTDVEYTIRVKDTKNGTSKTYFHALGTPAATILDTSAFASCP